MRIPVVFAMDSVGSAPNYTLKALERMGHETKRITPDEYFESDPREYDLYFAQDSGDGIDFRKASDDHLRKTSMWYWDSAWNHKQRSPGDDEMAAYISERGGWIFHAWRSDLERCARRYLVQRQSLLSVAGDPYIWSDEPAEEKVHDLSLVGNCYDPGRGYILNYAQEHCNLFWPGPNSNFFQDAARIYRQSWAVLHAPTFFQLPHDVTGERVDLMQGATMRHYEALCCGVPLVTTPKPDFAELGFEEGVHIFTWNEVEQIPGAAARAKKIAQGGGVEYAKKLRRFILDGHTYEHRIVTALGQLRSAGMI